MNFDYSEEERALTSQARRLLAERSPPSLVRALLDGKQHEQAASLWREVAALGWPAIAIAEDDGGIGFGHAGLCALAEEVGRAVAPLPLISSIYLAAQALAAGGSAGQRAAWLPRIASGEITGTAAIDPVAPPLACACGKLDGSVAPVPDGMAAAVAVVSARHGQGSQLFVVALDQPSVERIAVHTLDDSRPQARLTFDGAVAEPLGTGALSAEALLARAAVPIAFEQLGGADACLEATLAFVRERRCFGRPVGGYQAIKHRLADMYVANELARSNAYYAAWALATDAPELMLAAATARVSATEAYEFAAAEAIQVHGGIGFTWDADCHLHYRRSRVLAQIIEPLPWWQDRLARALDPMLDLAEARLMDFNDSPLEAAFRAEARAWLAAHAPAFAPPPGAVDAEGFATLPLARRWQAAKAESRYARIAWPENLGGRGGSAIDEVIFEEEQRRFPLPPDAFGISLGLCIATMIAWAPDLARERFVRPALRGDEIWCQLFSEPSAGSDLANVRTRAVRDGADWIINGQKVWTTGAHVADWGTILVRTDPAAEKYAGMSYFWIDMHAPGIEIRPIRQANGHAAFNEVFLTDVRVPDTQRLGTVGGGWKVVISTLMNERMAVNEADICNITVDDLAAMACRVQRGGARPIDDAVTRQRLASLYARSAGVRTTRYRMLTRLARGELPGPEAAMGKLALARNIQDIGRLALDMRGPAGLLAGEDADGELAAMQEAWFYAAGLRIAGGTDEILRNTIAERVLGLPPEARVDRGRPFNEVSGNEISG